MTYETETTKAMTNFELAEAIIDDRIAHTGFSKDDRDWLVERELHETRESLVNGFNAIKRWDDTDDEEDELCEDEPRRVCDYDLGQLLGDFEWQYDTDEVIDMMSEIDYKTYTRFWKRADDMPTLDEIDRCQWTPIAENVSHLLEWYSKSSYDERDIWDVDEEQVIEALSNEDRDGNRTWKDMTGNEVRSVLYDAALVTSENVGCYAADDMSDHLDEMWDVLYWIGCEDLMLAVDDKDEEKMLERILVALTDEHQEWRYLTRKEAIKVVEGVIRG